MQSLACENLTCKLFNSSGHMCGIPAGNYVYWSRWSRLHHDQNNGYQHAPIPTHGGHKNPPWHETCAWGMRERTREGTVVYQGTDKQIWHSRLLIPCPPPPWVYSTVSPMWRSGGNSFDPTLEFGCKTEYKTVGLDVFGQHPLWKGILCLSLSPVQVWRRGRSASLSWLQYSERSSQWGQHSFEMYG